MRRLKADEQSAALLLFFNEFGLKLITTLQ